MSLESVRYSYVNIYRLCIHRVTSCSSYTWPGWAGWGACTARRAHLRQPRTTFPRPWRGRCHSKGWRNDNRLSDHLKDGRSGLAGTGGGGRGRVMGTGSDGRRVQASVFVPGQPSRAELGWCCTWRAAHCLPRLRRARRGRFPGPPAQHFEGSVAAERPFPHGGSVGEKTVGPLEVGAVIDVLHVAVRQAALPPPPHHR